MRDLHGVADGLYMAGCLAGLWSEDGCHPAPQQVTYCGGSESHRLLVTVLFHSPIQSRTYVL